MIKISGLFKHGKPVQCFEWNANRYRVLKLLLQDVKTKDIACKLNMSRKTVYFHKNGIKKELGLGPVSTQGLAGKKNFKEALVRKGFSLEKFEEKNLEVVSILPRGGDWGHRC